MVVPPPAAQKTGMSTGGRVVVAMAMATIGILGALWLGNNLVKNNPNGINNPPVAVDSGVTITGFHLSGWSSCDNPTKGYLPGASGCKGTVTLALTKTVSSGYILVDVPYGTGGDSWHGAINVKPGQTTATVPVTLDYSSVCYLAPTLRVNVYDRTINDPSKTLLTHGDWTFKTETCAGFPAGGLGG